MSESRFVVEPVLQFRSKSIVAYNAFHLKSSEMSGGSSERVESFLSSERFKANAARLRNREKYTGQITKGAKKRLTKAISLLIQSSPQTYQYNPVTKKHHNHQLTFITLTCPNIDETKDAAYTHKMLLQPMLRVLRNRYGMKSYVWKAELQKNGSVHYHITTELFIVHTSLRNEWNAIMRGQGLLEKFREKYGHDNPNSVDIHSVEKVNDMEAYLVKYISKEYQNDEKLTGKVWDCSKNLKESKYFVSSLTSDVHDVIKRDIDSGWASAIYSDKCVVIKYRMTDYYTSFSQKLIDTYYSHLNTITTWQPKKKRQNSKITTESLSVSSTLDKQENLTSLIPTSQSLKTFPTKSVQLQMLFSKSIFQRC